MSLKLRAGWIVLLLALVLAAGQLRLTASIDNGLEHVRFATTSRPASGDVVFVEIDGQSLERVGVWPWPRRLHADLLDALMELGAAEVVFDIDFSVASNAEDDARFAAALDRAGGYAFLAAFQQSGAEGAVRLNRPLPAFAAAALPALVNVDAGPSGLLRTVPLGLRTETDFIASLTSILARPGAELLGNLAIDYGIDLTRIDRVAAIDVLDGVVDATRLANKQVVIGASAIELRDFFSVPRFGVLPGPLVQIGAVETLKANRALSVLGFWPGLAIASLLGVLFVAFGRRLQAWQHGAIYLGLAIATELAAWLALHLGAISVSTSIVHAMALGIIALGLFDEIGSRRRSQEKLQRQRLMQQQVLDRVVSDNFDGILVLDDAGTIVAASHAAAHLLGQHGALAGRLAAQVLPGPLLDRLSQQTGPGPEHCRCDIGGQLRDLEYRVTFSSVPDAEADNAQRGIVCLTFEDTTERRRQQKRLDYLAHHDDMTGALNRQSLVGLIASLPAGCTVVMVSIGRMGIVNETFGHAVGDGVLRGVLQRLRETANGAVARLGGDVFALCIDHPLQARALAQLCETIKARLLTPYDIDGLTVMIGVALGVTTSAIADADAASLLRHADIALAKAKASPGRTLAIYDPAFEAGITARQELDLALRRALRRNEFYLLYQPQVDLASRAVIGAEALVRWQHKRLGSVSPAAFIPLAEETGLIVELGDWVLQQACREAASWAWGGTISVNVSAVQFLLGDVLGSVTAALAASGLSPHRLEIEITESLFVDNASSIIATLEQLRAMGIAIAIDDFGTGYSSLSYLTRLPIDKIKVDQSFVRALPEEKSLAIVETIVAMAHRLGKVVVAEGIETEEQCAILVGLDCAIGQGYLFAKPLDPAALAPPENEPVPQARSA